MSNTFLAFIEDAIVWLDPAPRDDPGDQLRAARARETAAPEPERRAAEEAAAKDLRDRCLHEAEGEHELTADVARQHWAAPYDNDYLAVTFPPSTVFKALDVVALSSREDLSFDDLKAAAAKEDRQVVLEMAQPLALKGKPWLTSIPVAEAGGALYLHHFFVAKAPSGEGTLARRSARRKILDGSSGLAQLENPHNHGGRAQSPHPGIPPHRVPLGRGVSAERALAAPPASAGAGAAVFERLFLTLGGPTVLGHPAPWKAYVVLNVELTQGQTPEPWDFIALSKGPPKNPTDYLAYEYVSNLYEGSYETWETCNSTEGNLTFADLDKLSELYIFYVRLVNGAWAILGTPASFQQQRYWMEESLPDIGQRRLHEIVIPGVHDAGTYDPEAKGTHIANNAQAQNLTFDGQLALGVRYFDCRLQKWDRVEIQRGRQLIARLEERPPCR